MQKLSIEDIILKIEAQEIFHAVASDYSFIIKIDNYVPYACAAVHDGHQFRKELWSKCLHTEYERWYEEDPMTKNMIKSHPIVISGLDSRFEYDLNRDPENAIYEDAWGKKLWKEPLTSNEKSRSLEKHQNFYKVVFALIKTLELQFGCCVVYDMHSYNWKRWDREVPTWNLGTSNIDNNRYENAVEAWRKQLSEIKLPHGIPTTAKVNDTFQGNGYFLKFITNNFNNTLVLATEVAKIYCDEDDQILYPEVVVAIKKGLKKQLRDHALNFYNIYSI
ncbi:MAG: N-formylglutamate amidohydrolase [Gelidibacter sp.]